MRQLNNRLQLNFRLLFVYRVLCDKKLQKIYLDEIAVVESLKDYIRIITSSSKYIIHRTLSSFTEELPTDKFIRIHRSFTIAIDKVDIVEGNSLEINGIRYTIGRSYLSETKDKILNRVKKSSNL